MVSDGQDETYEDFFARMLKEIDAVKPRRVILDFRFNSGGDGSKNLAVIHDFIKREDRPPWKDLYILISGRTGAGQDRPARPSFSLMRPAR